MRILSRLPLRSRLVLVALIAVVPALAVILYAQAVDRSSARERLLAENHRVLMTAATQQAGFFAGADRFLSLLSEFPGIRTADPATCKRLLPGLLRNHPGYINIWVADRDGSAMCGAAVLNSQQLKALAESGSQSRPDSRQRPWLQRALQAQSTVIGDYQISVTTGRPALVIAHPLLGPSGKVERVLAALVEIQQLNDLAAQAQLPAGASLTTLDRHRTILARYPDGDRWIGTRLPASLPIVGLDANAADGPLEAIGVDGVRRLYISTPVVGVAGRLDSGLFVAMGVNPATAFAATNRRLQQELWLLALLSLATVLFAGFGGEAFVLRPMKALHRLATELAAGEMSARAHVAAGAPGIRELGDAINVMAAALETRDHRLRESEDRYRHLFEQNPYPMWVCDIDTHQFLAVNDAAVEQYGYAREEFLAMKTTDIRPADDVPRLLSVMAKEAGEAWSRSTGWRHRLKSDRLIDVDVASRRMTYGDRRCGLVVAQDVTDRNLAERALAEQHAMTALTADVASALNEPGLRWPALQTSADAIIRHLKADVARVWTINADTGVLELQASAGCWTDLNEVENVTPVGQSMVGLIARHGSRRVVANLAHDPEGAGEERAIAAGFTAFVGFPLTVQNRVTGVVGVFSRQPLSPAALIGLGIITDQLALGIERYRTEDARRLLASIVENSNDAVIGNSLDGTVLSWNASTERLYGYTAKEMIGRSAETLVPDDLNGEFQQLLRRVRSGDHVRQHETVRRRKDGSLVAVSLTLSPIRNEAGTVTALSAIVRDLTDQQNAERAIRVAEARMRFALDASRTGIWESDYTTGATQWSETLEALHGLAPGTFSGTFEAFIDLVCPDDRQTVRDAIKYAAEHHIDANIEYRTVWPDGTEHWLSGVGHTVYDETGRPLRAAGVGIDITARRGLEHQLRQAQKIEAIGQLAGGVAHDFNNLLTVIQGHAQFLADELPVEDARRRDADEILRTSGRAAELTRQLLAFGRKQVLKPSVLQLGEVVAETIPMLRRLIGETIDFNTTTRDRGRVKADASQIEQVLVNLAVNGRDAMKRGGRLQIETADVTLTDLTARAHPSLRPGPHVMLTVTDTGCGMDAKTQARIFEPFFTTKPQGEGTGLGLSTIYGIVQQSGGSITVESEVGRGSTFRIYFPCSTEPVTDGNRPSAPRAAGGSETIVLVEDEGPVRDLVARTLTGRGYRVHPFAKPRMAIDFAGTYRDAIDLVITDMVMPELGGRDVAAAVRRSHPEARILFMSGYAGDTVVDNPSPDFLSAFVQKPFAMNALAGKVRELLAAPRAGQAADLDPSAAVEDERVHIENGNGTRSKLCA